MTKTFVPFIEDNEWEGERWTVWLQVEGNEEPLRELYELLYTHRDSLKSYDLDLGNRESEEVVEGLERNADMGYMPEHMVVTGKLTIPVFEDVQDLDRRLYKAGIEFWFHEKEE